MTLTNYYELLEIAPDASAEDVKRSFRAQIARYHPDKVQHLGKEFQSLAAERAAGLTEAYRVLSDAALRAEYDRDRASGVEADPIPSPPAASPAAPASPTPGAASAPPPAAAPPPRGGQFSEERATGDEFVRRATMSRLRRALEASGSDYDEAQLRGFDLALTPRSKLFGRSPNPRLLVRFNAILDREAVADAWAQASKWGGPKQDEVCVLLLGSAVAPARELAGEINLQRRQSRGVRVTVIPVDARVWDAHMPLDAPAMAKTLLARLKSGS